MGEEEGAAAVVAAAAAAAANDDDDRSSAKYHDEMGRVHQGRGAQNRTRRRGVESLWNATISNEMDEKARNAQTRRSAC